MEDSIRTENSILLSIKKKLGIDADYTHFDLDIIDAINTVFFTLKQIGLKKSFKISGETETWNDFFSHEDNDEIEAVKTYIYCRVRKIFDPPTISSVMQALNETIQEYEWRLNIATDDWGGQIDV